MKLLQWLEIVVSGFLMHARYLFRKEKKYKPIVERYPDKISGRGPEDLPFSYKGYLKNNLNLCSGCGACEPLCPTSALKLKTGRRSEGSEYVQEFSIDLGRCFSCGICVEECPEESLSFSREFELAPISKSDLVNVYRGDHQKTDKMTVRIRTYEVRR